MPGADGRAEQVYFALDVSPIKDEYTLAYDWDGDREVTWTLVEGKMLKALDGAYTLRRPRQRLDRGHLPPRPRRQHPADRHAQAQGREDPHRHRAQGPEEARRVALSARVLTRADPPLHRQGRRRQVDRRGRYGGALGRRPASARSCCPPTRRTRSLTRSAPRREPNPPRWRPACSSSRSTPSCASSSRGPRSRATCCACSTSPASTRSPPRS